MSVRHYYTSDDAGRKSWQPFTASGPAADILEGLLLVDGAGSGLDADLLDGHEATYFATADHLHTDTYVPLITSPVNGNIPLMNAVGGLNTSSYKPADFQPIDTDLTAIAALGFTAISFLKKTAANTWALDTTAYQEYDIILDGITDLNWSSGTPFVKMTAPGTFAL
ncbi:hypothetical protein D4R42_02615, partial [bacterium]